MSRWVAVPGFPDYIISDEGEIISNRPWARGFRPQRKIKPAFDYRGYPAVSLRDPYGRSRTQKVHWLVAAAFIGPRPAGLQIRHLDSNPANCRADNLAYGTQLENMADRVALRTHCVNGHPYAEHGYPRPISGRACRECLREADRRRQPRIRKASG